LIIPYILPVRSKAKITSAFGGNSGIDTVLSSVIDSPGRSVASSVSGEIDALADITKPSTSNMVTTMHINFFFIFFLLDSKSVLSKVF